MQIVSGRYQNYQNGAVNNQLKDVGRERESKLGGDSESVDVWHSSSPTGY
jgi:hypothetical protein